MSSNSEQSPVAAPIVLTYAARQSLGKRQHYLENREALKARALARYYDKHEQCKTESRERARKNKRRLLELEALILQKQNPAPV